MSELVKDPVSFKKFTLIGPDVSRGSDVIRPNPLRQNHWTLQFVFYVFFSCKAFWKWACKRLWTDVLGPYRSVAIGSSPYQLVLLRIKPYLFVLTRAYTIADCSVTVVRPSWFVSLRIKPCRSVTIHVSPEAFGSKSARLRTHTVVCPYWNRRGLRNFTFP
jgi:hypothetical protein